LSKQNNNCFRATRILKSHSLQRCRKIGFAPSPINSVPPHKPRPNSRKSCASIFVTTLRSSPTDIIISFTRQQHRIIQKVIRPKQNSTSSSYTYFTSLSTGTRRCTVIAINQQVSSHISCNTRVLRVQMFRGILHITRIHPTVVISTYIYMVPVCEGTEIHTTDRRGRESDFYYFVMSVPIKIYGTTGLSPRLMRDFLRPSYAYNIYTHERYNIFRPRTMGVSRKRIIIYCIYANETDGRGTAESLSGKSQDRKASNAYNTFLRTH